MTVDEAALASAEASLGVSRPTDYRAIMTLSDGLAEMFPNAYLVLWCLDEVLEINKRDGYGPHESLPDLLLVGSDGGGELLALDLRAEQSAVVLVNAISSSWDEVVRQADTLQDLLSRLRAGRCYSFSS